MLNSEVCGSPLPAHAIRQPNWEFSYEESAANERRSCETPCSFSSETKACRATKKDCTFLINPPELYKLKLKLRGFGPLANYADRAV
jgi:hypothetical protein